MVAGSSVKYYTDVQSNGSVAPLIPRVKIEGGRSRLSSDLTAISEYEIPVDEAWEFSRDRSVQGLDYY